MSYLKQYAQFLCKSSILFLLGFNLKLKYQIIAKTTMQLGTTAKLGQQWDRRPSEPHLLSERPLASANREKEGKKGKYSSTVSSSECRNTRCIPPGLTLESTLRGWGATKKSWRLAGTRATLTDSGSLCCSRKAENSTSLSLVVPIDRPCHAGTEGAGADVGSNPKIKEPFSRRSWQFLSLYFLN